MSRIFFTALFFGFIFSSAFISYKTPQYDWDMLAYSAIYYHSTGMEDAQVHEYVYDTLIPSLPAGTASFLIDKPNEVACAHNTYFFTQQIPFYAIKPAYNFLIKLLARFTKSPVRAMTIISVLCYILFCIIIWLWLTLYLDYIWGCLAALCISALPLVITQGRLFTPDAVSTLLTLAALFFLYEKKKEYVSFGLLLLSLLFRPDNVFLILIVSGFVIYRAYKYLYKINIAAIALAATSLIVYITMSLVYKGYGWRVTFMHSIIDLNALPYYWTRIPLTITMYFKYLGTGFLTFKMRWIYSFFLWILTYFAIKKSNHHSKMLLQVMAILSILMVIKFLIFPLFDDRYFAVQYIFAMMMICIAILPGRKRMVEPVS